MKLKPLSILVLLALVAVLAAVPRLLPIFIFVGYVLARQKKHLRDHKDGEENSPHPQAQQAQQAKRRLQAHPSRSGAPVREQTFSMPETQFYDSRDEIEPWNLPPENPPWEL